MGTPEPRPRPPDSQALAELLEDIKAAGQALDRALEARAAAPVATAASRPGPATARGQLQ